MRRVHAAVLLVLSASPAFAQRGPVFVIPGKPGVPVLMNGVDISWSVIEGEFGLSRPGQVTPIVIYRPFLITAPTPYYGAVYREPGYFPTTGTRPGYGRLEVVPPPNRPLPAPAPTYYRSWSSQSDPGPADDMPSYGQSSAWGGYHRHRRHRGTAQNPSKNTPQTRSEGVQQSPDHGRM